MARQEVCFKENCFTVELAKTVGQQANGLMRRDSLEKNKGMLFVYEKEEPHAIWMKNMKFAIDVVWLNKNKEIIFMKENVPPCDTFACPLYSADAASAYVLELPAGTVERIGLAKKAMMQ